MIKKIDNSYMVEKNGKTHLFKTIHEASKFVDNIVYKRTIKDIRMIKLKKLKTISDGNIQKFKQKIQKVPKYRILGKKEIMNSEKFQKETWKKLTQLIH